MPASCRWLLTALFGLLLVVGAGAQTPFVPARTKGGAKGNDVELYGLAFGDREGVARLNLELVAAKIREDAVSVPAKLHEHLQRVITRRDRAAEDGNFRLCRESARVVFLVVLHGAVEHEECTR